MVTEYLKDSGLLPYLEKLGFHLVGYGCTTCIGNSGPLPEPVANAIQEGDLVAAAVLSGNRNFEGRIHANVRANYLASPPLVVAYALAGSMDSISTTNRWETTRGQAGLSERYLAVAAGSSGGDAQVRAPEMFKKEYSQATEGDEHWKEMPVPAGELFQWDVQSTYVRQAPYFEEMTEDTRRTQDNQRRARAGAARRFGHDGSYFAGGLHREERSGGALSDEQRRAPKDFNPYGARRGNHEVMVRGTFANVRLKNHAWRRAPKAAYTVHLPDKKQMSIYDAAMQYQKEGVSARSSCRQRIRHRLVARLGGEGPDACSA